VHVATTDDNGPRRLDVPLGQAQRKDDVTFWYFPRQTQFYTASWPLTRWLCRHVLDYDLVHVHAVFSYSSTVASLLAERHRVPYVILPHGILRPWGMQNRHHGLKRLSFALLERHYLSTATFVQCTSASEASEIRALGVTSPIYVLPLGIELSQYETLPPPRAVCDASLPIRERLQVLFIGRFDATKGLDTLLQALARLRCRLPRMALVLAGNGSAKQIAILRKQIRDLKLDDDVVLPGFLDDSAKLAALADADVVVLPSYTESFGLAAVEAMASGRPVIVSDQVAIHREIAEAQAGLVVPCQADALADALASLAHDPELRRRLGDNGRRLVRKQFSLESTTARLMQAYVGAVQGCLPVPIA